MASVVVGWKVCPWQFVSATVSVAFDAHGPWLSNIEYQTNVTHVPTVLVDPRKRGLGVQNWFSTSCLSHGGRPVGCQFIAISSCFRNKPEGAAFRCAGCRVMAAVSSWFVAAVGRIRAWVRWYVRRPIRALIKLYRQHRHHHHHQQQRLSPLESDVAFSLNMGPKIRKYVWSQVKPPLSLSIEWSGRLVHRWLSCMPVSEFFSPTGRKICRRSAVERTFSEWLNSACPTATCTGM